MFDNLYFEEYLDSGDSLEFIDHQLFLNELLITDNIKEMKYTSLNDL
jgi:hypothetical protein